VSSKTNGVFVGGMFNSVYHWNLATKVVNSMHQNGHDVSARHHNTTHSFPIYGFSSVQEQWLMPRSPISPCWNRTDHIWVILTTYIYHKTQSLYQISDKPCIGGTTFHSHNLGIHDNLQYVCLFIHLQFYIVLSVLWFIVFDYPLSSLNFSDGCMMKNDSTISYTCMFVYL
jgi:hypothetical protein